MVKESQIQSREHLIATMFILRRFSALVCLFSIFGRIVTSLPMEPQCSSFHYEYKTLETMIRTERTVEDMKKDMTKIQEDVTMKLQQLADNEGEWEKKIAEMSKEMDEKLGKITADNQNARKQLDEKLKTIEGLVSEDVVSNQGKSPVIAFSAMDFTGNLANGVPTFKKVITNLGDAYNQETGVFTCTLDGLYMFTLTVGSDRSDRNSYCRIQLNGQNVAISLTYNTEYTTSSNSVFLELFKGNTVSPGGCSNVPDFYTADLATSFSGALITVT